LAIIIHEVLQEISEFFVFKDAGYSTKKSIIINFLTSLTIFIGIGISFTFKDTNIQFIILAISSGFFLNIVYDDLLPHKKHTKDLKKHFLALIFGSVFIVGVLLVFSH
jgi:zinc and cadmium transporter